jgi:ABC-type multidrug transport system fused ATPase/permease subunit
MTSVERIIEYTQISSEHSLKSNKKSPTNWPMKGQIVFKNVSLKYDPNLPEVIKDISLSINPSQKIGFDFKEYFLIFFKKLESYLHFFRIIGRTGAGKSSFFQTLFRMYEPTGTIYIDGIDLKSLNLFDLRSKLTIIPVKYNSVYHIYLNFTLNRLLDFY